MWQFSAADRDLELAVAVTTLPTGLHLTCRVKKTDKKTNFTQNPKHFAISAWNLGVTTWGSRHEPFQERMGGGGVVKGQKKNATIFKKITNIAPWSSPLDVR